MGFADELYDLQADPEETTNLADQPEFADICGDLSARIDQFFAQHAHPEADLWTGGRPIQNTARGELWRTVWGEDWEPVFQYDGA